MIAICYSSAACEGAFDNAEQICAAYKGLVGGANPDTLAAAVNLSRVSAAPDSALAAVSCGSRKSTRGGSKARRLRRSLCKSIVHNRPPNRCRQDGCISLCESVETAA
jgi:hypothetical protein